MPAKSLYMRDPAALSFMFIKVCMTSLWTPSDFKTYLKLIKNRTKDPLKNKYAKKSSVELRLKQIRLGVMQLQSNILNKSFFL